MNSIHINSISREKISSRILIHSSTHVYCVLHNYYLYFKEKRSQVESLFTHLRVYCVLYTYYLYFKEKRSQVESFAGETILRGEEFKKYVNSLREKSNIYKQRRTELSDLKAEYGVLERTTEILK